MKQIINHLKNNYLAIIFLICIVIFIGIVNTLVIIILSLIALVIFFHFKDEFDFKKAKDYFNKKNDK
jgi:UPF0716 family protein affecting phage T7 exclusion